MNEETGEQIAEAIEQSVSSAIEAAEERAELAEELAEELADAALEGERMRRVENVERELSEWQSRMTATQETAERALSATGGFASEVEALRMMMQSLDVAVGSLAERVAAMEAPPQSISVQSEPTRDEIVTVTEPTPALESAATDAVPPLKRRVRLV